MTSTISTDDGAIQSGTSAQKQQQDAVTAAGGRSAPASGVDNRLAAVQAGAADDNARGAERNREGLERTSKDSAGKTAIDRSGAANVNGLGNSAGKSLLNALGSALAGGGSGGGSPAMSSPVAAPPMPSMPQIPAATAGQSLPMSLSNPAAIMQLARLLSGDSSGMGGLGGMMGMGGLSTMSGRGGGSGGPAGSGSNVFEQRILAHARQVAAAGLPYTYGGGTTSGPGYGTAGLNGVADANRDYLKRGFDCSSLVQYLTYQSSGVEIPRTSEAQYSAGITINPANARPGDLLFPSSAGVPPSHVVMYVGGGKVIEAQQSGTTIGFADVRPGTFKRYVSAG